MKYTLPRPPSVNGLFISAGKFRAKSPAYRMWIEQAEKHLLIQKIKVFQGPVAISLTIEDIGRGDLDNLYKAVSDLLVKHGVISDDNRPIVRKISMAWGAVKGCEVEIMPHEVG